MQVTIDVEQLRSEVQDKYTDVAQGLTFSARKPA